MKLHVGDGGVARGHCRRDGHRAARYVVAVGVGADGGGWWRRATPHGDAPGGGGVTVTVGDARVELVQAIARRVERHGVRVRGVRGDQAVSAHEKFNLCHRTGAAYAVGIVRVGAERDPDPGPHLGAVTRAAHRHRGFVPVLCHPSLLARETERGKIGRHPHRVDVEHAVVTHLGVHSKLYVPAVGIRPRQRLAGIIENLLPVEVYAREPAGAGRLAVVDFDVVPRVRLDLTEVIAVARAAAGLRPVTDTLVVKFVVAVVADSEGTVRIAGHLPLRDDRGVLGDLVPRIRWEVERRSVIDVVALEVHVSNGADLGSVRGVLSAWDVVVQTAGAAVGPVLEHALAPSRPVEAGEHLVAVKGGDAPVPVAIPRGVPVDAALALGDLVPATFAATFDGGLHVHAEARLEGGTQPGAPVGEAVLPVQEEFSPHAPARAENHRHDEDPR